MSNTLDTFQEATTVQSTDLLHLKRGVGTNSDKFISGFNLKAEVANNSKTICIESPTDSEDISFFFTNKAITITRIRVVLTGSSTPSVTWTIRHSTDRSAVGGEVVTGGTVTTNTTLGSDITTFDDPTVIVDSHLWIETTAKSGVVNSMVITVFFTED